MGFLMLLYLVLGYWAVGRTYYANKIIIGDGASIFARKFITAFLFGWFWIPIAILGSLGKDR